MVGIETPVTRAYRQLAELSQNNGVGFSGTHLFALAWLAAGRMVTMEKVDGISSVHQLTEPGAWEALEKAGYPIDAYDYFAAHRSLAIAQGVGLRAAAAKIISELDAELGGHRWDVLPCLTESRGRREEAAGTVVPELASLLMDMVGAPPDSEVWIPFDFQGQLTVEALRRGWRVITASPLGAWSQITQLVLTIETGQAHPSTVRTEIERDEAGRPIGRADFAIVMPPIGINVKESRMSIWDITGARPYEQYVRSESWAIFEFANRIDKRAIFVTPQGVLFAQGQEQRLREYLMQRSADSSQLQAVITLPPGVFGGAAIAGSIVVLSALDGDDAVYMSDLGSGRRSLQEAGAVISSGREIALGQATSNKARLVGRHEVSENDFSLVPSRYLRRVPDLGDNVVKLGDICVALRPPVTSKEAGPFKVAEVGLSDLQKWHPISHVIEKSVYLKSTPKDSSLAQPGDIIISIKGSVGRVALMGGAAEHRPTVVSQSCLALRLNLNLGETYFSPEVLVMYLRSPHGQAQLAGLQVGAGVQHISPTTLMGAVSVPLPSADDCQEIRRDFDKLCNIEAQIAGLESEIADISGRRWPDELQ